MIKELQELEKEFTKYEIARILGARALQISMDAPLLVNISKEKLEKIKYDPIKIAEIEFRSDVLPITVKRPLPKKEGEEDEKEKFLNEKETKEKIQNIVKGDISEADAIDEAEESEEEAEDNDEIMELARPEDEKEDNGGESVGEKEV